MQANTLDQKDAPSQMSEGRGGQYISTRGTSGCLSRQKLPKSGYFGLEMADFPPLSIVLTPLPEVHFVRKEDIFETDFSTITPLHHTLRNFQKPPPDWLFSRTDYTGTKGF
jgi:hypothetical protein